MPEPPYLRTTRTAYDTVAVDYAELVQAAGVGPVADLGCGPGRVTAHLHSLGLSAFGVDLSPAMVAVAAVAGGLRRVPGTWGTNLGKWR
jgi:trans-aconitate methyltransferase